MANGEDRRIVVTCPECTARYRLDSSRVSGLGARITCPRCKNVFVVYPDETEPGSTAPPESSTGSGKGESGSDKSRRRAADLDFRKVGIASWKVRVKIGLVYDFSEIKTLRKYIADGRVTPEDVISHDGSTWVPIGDIPDLDSYFVEVYERAEAGVVPEPESEPEPEAEAIAPSPLPSATSFGEDNPTRVMRGGGGLGSSMAAQTLAAAAAEAAQVEADLSPASGARPFVDPFAQLQEEKRRRPAAKRTSAPTQAPKSKTMPLVAALVALTVVGLGVWWFQTPEETPVVLPSKTQEPTPELDQARANATSELEKLDEELRLDLERSRAEEAERVDRDKLVPVGPSGPGPGLRPVVPDTARQLESDPIAVNHGDQCKMAAGRSDWKSAISSCSLATQANARDMKSQVRYGIALFETGNSDGAGVQLEKAKSLGSRDARIEKYLGHIAKKQGDVFGANAHYQAYLVTKPRDAAEIQALMQGG